MLDVIISNRNVRKCRIIWGHPQLFERMFTGGMRCYTAEAAGA